MVEDSELINYYQDCMDHLKMELCVSDNNYGIGSGLGGNLTQLHHLITNNFAISLHDEDTFVFSREGNHVINLTAPRLEEVPTNRVKHEPRNAIRLALNEYQSKENLKEVTEAMMKDFKWLIENSADLQDYANFVSAVALSARVVELLNTKASKPEDFTDNVSVYDLHKIKDQAAKEEIFKNITEIDNYKSFITSFCFRAVIGLEFIVKYEIDELPTAGLLHCTKMINKYMD